MISVATALALQPRTPAGCGRYIASVYLGMALDTVRIECGAEIPPCNCLLELVNIGVAVASVARMAAQAQKRRRLTQKIVRHGPVGVVTDGAVLFNGRVLIDKWPLLVRMALVADHVDGRFLQVPGGAAVRVMATGAFHLPFLERMVRRQRELGGNILVARIAGFRVVDRHGQATLPLHTGMPDVRETGNLGARVRIVAIDARYAMKGMGRRFPAHRGMALVALQAQIRARFLANVAVGIVASFALEVVLAVNLVGMSDAFEFLRLLMAAVARLDATGAHGVRRNANRAYVHGFFLGLQEGRPEHLRVLLIHGRHLGGRCAGRYVVMPLVAIGARHAAIRMGGRAPFGPRGTRVFFVALQAHFAALGRSHLLEAENHARSLAARADMRAPRSVAGFAGLLAMDIGLVVFDVVLMARHAQLIILDHFRAFDFRNLRGNGRKRPFPEAIRHHGRVRTRVEFTAATSEQLWPGADARGAAKKANPKETNPRGPIT